MLVNSSGELASTESGFRSPGCRAEDSGLRGPRFESRLLTNFQRLWRISEIGIHMSHRRPSVKEELRRNFDLMECVSLTAIIQKAKFVRVGAVVNDKRGNYEVDREV